MVGGLCNATLISMLLSLLIESVAALLFVERQVSRQSDPQRNKAILEMLHIDKVSASHHQARPHPYMRRIYELLETLEAQDWKDEDGTLVQSFRSVPGGVGAPPGWIWFNLTGVDPSTFPGGAELVLFRKILHPSPLSVSVALHGLTHAAAPQPATTTRGGEGVALDERRLRLDRRPPTGYDVFRAGALMGRLAPGSISLGPAASVGFQLRYTDEGGSLVLHEALTQSLYSLGPRGSPREPLLVLYRVHPREIHPDTQTPPPPSSTLTPAALVTD
ncbi:uncharacterized protein LOC115529475 [Gadus morhua]|uniref:Uncharacterized LOC115529475 n=1 Tax=Gadus morhua TaxID=8049 RepID=A0A8C5CHK7_GADMO|nr:uncharacterized protein LOC115529475 [Gadus morhua]